MTLPGEIRELLLRLEEAGHSAYAVGGCVRDALRGMEPQDYDLCTDALPEETEEILRDFPILEVGKKHGTVTVLTKRFPVEITTFRGEAPYSDGRHPDAVFFGVGLTADLARRDFTVNAIAYSPRTGIVDPFDGREDLSRGVLRCVGDPSLRFGEDALRILRALRFAATLGYSVDGETSRAMTACRARLRLISPERISTELKKTLAGQYAGEVLLSYPEIVSEILPPLASCVGYDQKNPHHAFDLYTHLCKTVSALPPDPILRLAGLLHDVGKPAVAVTDEAGIRHFPAHAEKGREIVASLLTRLRFSSSEKDRAVSLIRFHDGVIHETEQALRRRLNRFGQDFLTDLILLQKADGAAQTHDPTFRREHYEELFRIMNKVISESECFSLRDLAVNGHDLLALGKEGKEVGEALTLLLDAVIDGRVENNREALLRYLKEQT